MYELWAKFCIHGRQGPMHSGERRSCLNRLGHPQLDICGAPSMSVREVVKCFASTAADEEWEECVVKHCLLSTVAFTDLEKAFVLCRKLKENDEFVRCVTTYPPGDVGRKHCLNKNGSPQLEVCARPMTKDLVAKCFRGAAADEKWEDCVVSEYLGVYSKSMVDCYPELDTKYVEDLRKIRVSRK